MSGIRPYLEIKSLQDERRGIVQALIQEFNPSLEDIAVDALWVSLFAENYKKRVIDTFDKPEIGVTTELFRKRYKRRTLSDFKFYYPTHLLDSLLSVILTIDELSGKPIDIGEVQITVNVFPYEFDEELITMLADSITAKLPYKNAVRIISAADNTLTPNFFKQFTHVFKYDIFGEETANFQNNLINQPIPEVKFIVPDVFIKEPEIPMSPTDMLIATGAVLFNSLQIIPWNHTLYDCKFDKV